MAPRVLERDLSDVVGECRVAGHRDRQPEDPSLEPPDEDHGRVALLEPDSGEECLIGEPIKMPHHDMYDQLHERIRGAQSVTRAVVREVRKIAAVTKRSLSMKSMKHIEALPPSPLCRRRHATALSTAGGSNPRCRSASAGADRRSGQPFRAFNGVGVACRR